MELIMQPQQTNVFVQFLPMVLIFGIFYFLVIRPEKEKQKKHQELLKNLSKNDEVLTSGGIHGIVVNVKEKTVVLRLDESVRVEFEKDAVVLVIKKGE
ncbi:MAG: preprotein translocase subunit YajC [Candidatus Omnitrophica bacterium]|nr:preprotein translocase subunit YajC [Candidatus Omnitrophota bacterium]